MCTGIKDLTAWTDMETFRRVPRFMEEKRDKKAREIRDSWLGKKYFFGADSPATREGQNFVSKQLYVNERNKESGTVNFQIAGCSSTVKIFDFKIG